MFRDDLPRRLRDHVERGPEARARPPQRPDGDAYVRVDDVALESFGLTDAGVPLASPLTKREYGMWELEVCDPDGYRICFGQDLGQ